MQRKVSDQQAHTLKATQPILKRTKTNIWNLSQINKSKLHSKKMQNSKTNCNKPKKN